MLLKHRVAERGYEATMVLLEHRTDVDAKDKDGGTVLHQAAGKGHDTVVRLLDDDTAHLPAHYQMFTFLIYRFQGSFCF
jgi:hypothetical protein